MQFFFLKNICDMNASYNIGARFFMRSLPKLIKTKKIEMFRKKQEFLLFYMGGLDRNGTAM